MPTGRTSASNCSAQAGEVTTTTRAPKTQLSSLKTTSWPQEVKNQAISTTETPKTFHLKMASSSKWTINLPKSTTRCSKSWVACFQRRFRDQDPAIRARGLKVRMRRNHFKCKCLAPKMFRSFQKSQNKKLPKNSLCRRKGPNKKKLKKYWGLTSAEPVKVGLLHQFLNTSVPNRQFLKLRFLKKLFHEKLVLYS